MPFVDDTCVHAELGDTFAEVLCDLLLFEFAEVEEPLQRQSRTGCRALCTDLADWLPRSRNIRRIR